MAGNELPGRAPGELDANRGRDSIDPDQLTLGGGFDAARGRKAPPLEAEGLRHRFRRSREGFPPPRRSEA